MPVALFLMVSLPAAGLSIQPGDVAPEDLDGPVVDSSAVLDTIRDILSDPRYAQDRRSWIERLLGPLYTWLERMVAFVAEMASRALQQVLSWLTLDTFTWLGPLMVLVAAVIGGLVLGRRRAREIERRATIERILELGADPGELEALADEALETDPGESIRLRFVAGLLRLDAAGRIDFYPGLANSVISDALSEPLFDELATEFDRVVYGRRPATATDATRARADWRTLLGVRA